MGMNVDKKLNENLKRELKEVTSAKPGSKTIKVIRNDMKMGKKLA